MAKRPARRKGGANTCSGCPAEWASLLNAHCGGCHETFSRVVNFDSHRALLGGCLDPGTLRVRGRGNRSGEPLLRRDSRGIWVSARERPEHLNHAEAT